jgi:hypothetical protein
MTHTECQQPHCAYCVYRHAAGTLTIHSPIRSQSEHVCCTCAAEALDYYRGNTRWHASFIPWPTP